MSSKILHKLSETILLFVGDETTTKYLFFYLFKGDYFVKCSWNLWLIFWFYTQIIRMHFYRKNVCVF